MIGNTKIHNQKTKATAKDGKLKEELSLKSDNLVDEVEASPVRKSSSGNVGWIPEWHKMYQCRLIPL